MARGKRSQKGLPMGGDAGNAPESTIKGRKRGGGPTKAQLEMIPKLYMANVGLTDVELARILGVHVATVHRWKLESVAFSRAIEDGKETADAEVAHSLYKLATGKATVKRKQLDKDNNVVEMEQGVIADTAAAFIWLKNRKGWRDKTEHQVDVNVNFQVDEYAKELGRRVGPELANQLLEAFGYRRDVIDVTPVHDKSLIEHKKDDETIDQSTPID